MDFRELYSHHVDKSDTIICLASPLFFQSGWCLIELFEAVIRKKPIVLVALPEWDPVATLRYLEDLGASLQATRPAVLGQLRTHLNNWESGSNYNAHYAVHSPHSPSSPAALSASTAAGASTVASTASAFATASASAASAASAFARASTSRDISTFASSSAPGYAADGLKEIPKDSPGEAGPSKLNEPRKRSLERQGSRQGSSTMRQCSSTMRQCSFKAPLVLPRAFLRQQSSSKEVMAAEALLRMSEQREAREQIGQASAKEQIRLLSQMLIRALDLKAIADTARADAARDGDDAAARETREQTRDTSTTCGAPRSKRALVRLDPSFASSSALTATMTTIAERMSEALGRPLPKWSKKDDELKSIIDAQKAMVMGKEVWKAVRIALCRRLCGLRAPPPAPRYKLFIMRDVADELACSSAIYLQQILQRELSGEVYSRPRTESRGRCLMVPVSLITSLACLRVHQVVTQSLHQSASADEMSEEAIQSTSMLLEEGVKNSEALLLLLTQDVLKRPSVREA